MKYEAEKSRLFKPLTTLTLRAQVRRVTTLFVIGVTACIKVLPVFTSTRVLVKVLGRVLE